MENAKQASATGRYTDTEQHHSTSSDRLFTVRSWSSQLNLLKHVCSSHQPSQHLEGPCSKAIEVERWPLTFMLIEEVSWNYVRNKRPRLTANDKERRHSGVEFNPAHHHLGGTKNAQIYLTESFSRTRATYDARPDFLLYLQGTIDPSGHVHLEFLPLERNPHRRIKGS